MAVAHAGADVARGSGGTYGSYELALHVGVEWTPLISIFLTHAQLLQLCGLQSHTLKIELPLLPSWKSGSVPSSVQRSREGVPLTESGLNIKVFASDRISANNGVY